eukprot:996230_1
MLQYNHHIRTLNYVYGIFTNSRMQFCTNLVKYQSIHTHHKIMLEKYGFSTFIWTSRLIYGTCNIFYWFKRLKIHCFNEHEKPQSQSVKEMVGKNDENAREQNNNVDISLKTLKMHGIKYFSMVKQVDYCGSYDFMAWTIMVLSGRIQK